VPGLYGAAMTLPPQHALYRVAALYRFCRLERFAELRAPLAAFCCGRGIKGTLLLAHEKILDNVYKKTCRPKLIQPTFIIDYPVSFNPFAKRKEGDATLIDRFQLLAGGLELVNAFSELNDPVDQMIRYKEQDKKGAEGEVEISPSDIEYVEAMEYGMPPNGGIGIGIDRVAMLFTDSKNIREVILFPTLRPKE
jgi:lysyl-tRNA synthetase class 2